jgi:hypothetical protein
MNPKAFALQTKSSGLNLVFRFKKQILYFIQKKN